MKKVPIKTVAALAVLPLLCAQCSKLGGGEDLKPDKPSDRTVTLTVTTSDAHSPGGDTRTTLGEDLQVLWSQGDRISINNVTYEVIPDPDDPSVATVEGVIESDSYVAVYPSGRVTNSSSWKEDGEIRLGFNTYLSYAENSFADYNNAMVAYSTTTDLQFRNIGGILRIGITGNTGGMRSLYLTTGESHPVSGVVPVSLDDLVSGDLKDTYPVDPGDWYGSTVVLEDDDMDPMPVNPSDPSYFYFVLPSSVYQEGFTLTMEDAEGNVAVKKKTSAVSVLRSRVTTMETVAFDPVPAPEIVSAVPTSSSVTFDITAEPGIKVLAGLIYKAVYDSMTDPEEKAEYAKSAAWNPEGGSLSENASGSYTAVFQNVLNYDYEYVPVNPSMDYYAVVCYAVGGFEDDEIYPVGAPVLYQVSTSAGEGPAPEVSATLKEKVPYFERMLKISVSEDAAGIRVYSAPAYEYEKLSSDGLSDGTIALTFGSALDEDALKQAQSDTCSITLNDIFFAATDYVFLVAATGEGGAVAVHKEIYSSPDLFTGSETWMNIAQYAQITFSISYTDYSTGEYKTFDVGHVSLEKTPGRELYRVTAGLDEDTGFVSYMQQEWGCTTDGTDACLYLYSPELENGSSSNRLIMPVSGSLSGFRTSDGRQVAFLTDYSPGYITVSDNWIDLSCNVNMYAVSEDGSIEERFTDQMLYFNIDVSYFGEFPAGMSNESFVINEEKDW